MNAAQTQPVPPQNSWHREFSGTMEDISAAAQWLDSIATGQKLPEQLVFSLQLCLEELLSNIVRHGGTGHWQSGGDLPQAAPLKVDITIGIDGRHVTMTVEDDGKPFDIVNAPAHAIDRPLGKVEPGGLGLQLIKNFASTLSYEQAGLGNRVVAEFLR